MNNRKYRVGIIGCGRVAGYLEDDQLRNYPCTHIGAYNSLSECEVVACCSQEYEQVKAFASKFSIPRYYIDYKKMLKKEKLDIVSVATYAPTHAAITIRAAKSGVKAVFCEKAMATSLNEAKAMINVCNKEKTILAINHTRRWDHHYVKAKELINSGAIGTLQSIYGIFSGNLIHTGIHMFDLLNFFAGKALKVSGKLQAHYQKYEISSGYKFGIPWRGEIADKDGYATIIFENDVIAHISGKGKEYFVFELELVGSKGRIKIGNQGFSLWQSKKSKNYSDFNELQFVTDKVDGSSPSAFVVAIKEIINAIENGSKLSCSGKDAYSSLEMAVAIYASHNKNAKFIKLSSVNKRKKVLSR